MTQGITEGEALDRIEAIVEPYKGTDDPELRAIRHALHKAGRLNKPDPKGPFVVLETYEGFPQDPSAFDVKGFETWREAVGEANYARRDEGTIAVIRRVDPRSANATFAMRLGKHEANLAEVGESSLS